MKQLLLRLLVRLAVKELVKIPGVDDKDKEDGYARLFDNVKMMKNLENILVADTKSMMTTDCLKDDFQRGYRYGCFIRTRALISNAKRYYESQRKGK